MEQFHFFYKEPERISHRDTILMQKCGQENQSNSSSDAIFRKKVYCQIWAYIRLMSKHKPELLIHRNIQVRSTNHEIISLPQLLMYIFTPFLGRKCSRSCILDGQKDCLWIPRSNAWTSRIWSQCWKWPRTHCPSFTSEERRWMFRHIGGSLGLTEEFQYLRKTLSYWRNQSRSQNAVRCRCNMFRNVLNWWKSHHLHEYD